MADSRYGRGGGGRLNAREREVVFCHQCHSEWYFEDHRLVCPTCEGEVTEIITPDNDPRPESRPPNIPPDIRGLHNHNPWEESNSDPEEADIEESITHSPRGGILFTQTVRHTGPNITRITRRQSIPHNHENNPNPNDPAAIMSGFQSILTSILAPSNLEPGQVGRSGRETLFPGDPFGGGTNFQSYNGQTPNGQRFVGSRITFASGLRPRDVNGPQPGGPPIDELSSLLASMFAPMGGANAHDHDQHEHAHDPNDPNHHHHGFEAGNGLPQGLRGLFQAMLNPANARSGDAVYSQEALDQIISTLMEQHPTSTAPGPAPPDAIAALPKKKLDEKMLGPEGKADCPVCMDDVHLGDEVVSLPCSHWFHETCAAAWLGEHNTCPICRKGIDRVDEATTSHGRRASASNQSFGTGQRTHRMSFGARERLSRSNTTGGRSETERRNQEARLDAIRNAGRLTPTQESLTDPAPRPSWSRRSSNFSLLSASEQRTREEHARIPLFPRPRYHRHDTGNSRSSRDSEQRAQRRSSGQASPRGSESRSEAGTGGASGPLSWIRNQLRGSGDRRR